MVPRNEVGHFVTSRLEKYRPQTEAWLKQHGFKYGQLHMLDMKTAEERRAAGAHADFKAKIYMDTWAGLFIESSSRQALEIAQKTGKPVFCTDEQRMIVASSTNEPAGYRDAAKVVRWQAAYYAKKISDKLNRAVKRLVWKIIPRLQ